jgi:hypothetical protein
MEQGLDYNIMLQEAFGGMEWDTMSFEVHHINHNRIDNRLDNLLLLPKKLHKKYHLLLSHASYLCNDITNRDTSFIPTYHLDTISNLIECKNDMAYLYQEQERFIKNVREGRLYEMARDSYAEMIQETLDKYK